MVWGYLHSITFHYSSTHPVPGTRQSVALEKVLSDFTLSPSLLCLHLNFYISFKPVFQCHFLPTLRNILSSPAPNLCWQQSALCWHWLCILCCSATYHIKIQIQCLLTCLPKPAYELLEVRDYILLIFVFPAPGTIPSIYHSLNEDEEINLKNLT